MERPMYQASVTDLIEEPTKAGVTGSERLCPSAARCEDGIPAKRDLKAAMWKEDAIENITRIVAFAIAIIALFGPPVTEPWGDNVQLYAVGTAVWLWIAYGMFVRVERIKAPDFVRTSAVLLSVGSALFNGLISGLMISAHGFGDLAKIENWFMPPLLPTGLMALAHILLLREHPE